LAGDCVIIGIQDQKANAPKLIAVLKKEKFIRDIKEEEEKLRLYVTDGTKALPQVLAILRNEKINLNTITLTQPTLDDVFLKKTGYTLRDIEAKGGK
jgi:ABC-2 type transport system ATP-binding protein